MSRLAARLSPRTGAVLARDAAGRTLARAEAEALAPAGLAPEARVALCVRDPLDFLRCVLGLDGRVATLALLSHALAPETAAALAERAGCEVLVTDRDDLEGPSPAEALGTGEAPAAATRWLMTTSGTTGLPKVVPHSLDSLARSVSRFGGGEPPVWGMLYDPTRFAGLQVVLQALIGGGPLALADAAAPLAEQVAALAAAGTTALSATPTLWRRILMLPGHAALPLRQITLGGEIVDQPVLDALRAAYPDARITHIYASTEAGVGFSVTDGLAGFPARHLDAAPGGVSLKVVDGLLWVRPPVTALAPGGPVEVDAEGYVNTGDRLEIEGDRVRFLGRDNGTINVGGVKVHPERVEGVIAAVPGVAAARVSAKRSPLTGALIVAEVQPREGADRPALKAEILRACRATLEREAVPAAVRFVEGFALNAAGKLVRTREAAP